jgi:hypothetical protein
MDSVWVWVDKVRFDEVLEGLQSFGFIVGTSSPRDGLFIGRVPVHNRYDLESVDGVTSVVDSVNVQPYG